jgi:hypothetical protein
MISEASKAIAVQSRTIYDSQLRQRLERECPDQYVCIEPLSNRHFVGTTFDEAVHAALDAIPGHLTHTIHIGHSAAFHLGVLAQ